MKLCAGASAARIHLFPTGRLKLAESICTVAAEKNVDAAIVRETSRYYRWTLTSVVVVDIAIVKNQRLQAEAKNGTRKMIRVLLGCHTEVCCANARLRCSDDSQCLNDSGLARIVLADQQRERRELDRVINEPAKVLQAK